MQRILNNVSKGFRVAPIRCCSFYGSGGKAGDIADDLRCGQDQVNKRKR